MNKKINNNSRINEYVNKRMLGVRVSLVAIYDYLTKHVLPSRD